MILTVMAFFKHLLNGQARDATTIAVAFGVGVAVAFLLRASDFPVDIGETKLSDLNAASTVLVGFALASLARTGHQVIKAVDQSQSAAEPKLIPPTG